MGSEDNFEKRLKAIADQLARSLSDADVDEVAERFGVDPDRVRGVTGAVGRWLNDRSAEGEPLFGDKPAGRPDDPRKDVDHETIEVHATEEPPAPGGPHPLDLPTEAQALALSALDSGRWTLRPGSGRLTASLPTVGALPEGAASDLANELRARDWITADGAVTFVGREALQRWTRAAESRGDTAD